MEIFNELFDKYNNIVQLILLLSFITPIEYTKRVLFRIDEQSFFDLSALSIIIVLFTIGLTFIRQELWIAFIGNTIALIQWIIIFTYHTFLNRNLK